MLKNIFKKYAVICYIVHAERIAWCDTFYSLNAAKKYLKEFALRTLEKEKSYAKYYADIINVKADIQDDYAYIERETEDGWMRWTFEVKEVNKKVNITLLHLEESIESFMENFKRKYHLKT